MTLVMKGNIQDSAGVLTPRLEEIKLKKTCLPLNSLKFFCFVPLLNAQIQV
jgi:hypothetical protein